jgi:hypothetical protein
LLGLLGHPSLLPLGLLERKSSAALPRRGHDFLSLGQNDDLVRWEEFDELPYVRNYLVWVGLEQAEDGLRVIREQAWYWALNQNRI